MLGFLPDCMRKIPPTTTKRTPYKPCALERNVYTLLSQYAITFLNLTSNIITRMASPTYKPFKQWLEVHKLERPSNFL